METFYNIFMAILSQDYEMIRSARYLWMLPLILFLIISLENGVLPAAFFPGDSLLILVGVMASQGAFSFWGINLVLIVAASVGSWLGFIQGRWLSDTPLIKRWMANHLPPHRVEQTHALLHRHGLLALLAGRFMPFVRTLMPLVVGISPLSTARFQMFNVLSATLWVGLLTSLGYLISNTAFFSRHQEILTTCMLLLPILLLAIGLVSSLFYFAKRRFGSGRD